MIIHRIAFRDPEIFSGVTTCNVFIKDYLKTVKVLELSDYNLFCVILTIVVEIKFFKKLIAGELNGFSHNYSLYISVILFFKKISFFCDYTQLGYMPIFFNMVFGSIFCIGITIDFYRWSEKPR